jgi:hypothetical protein
MSDQPGIPAIMVFPPFNPAARPPEPAAEPVRDQVPEPAEQPAAPAAEGHGHDVAAPPAPAPWDFEAPAADDRGDEAAAAPLSEEEDLPWLEVPEPAPVRSADEPDAGLKADDAPNWMDWVRDAGQAPPADEPTPIADLQPDDAQPWAPETETAADDWAAPPQASGSDPWQAPPSSEAGDPQPAPWEAPAPEAGESASDPWQAPASPEVDPQHDSQVGGPWAQGDPQLDPQAGGPSADDEAPGTDLDVPEPELYDLPDVAPDATPWVEAEAPLFEPARPGEAEGDEAEPAWELPSHSAHDTPPAWESFAPTAAAPEAEPPAATSAPEGAGPFAAVADRLREISDALRADPGAFLSGAQGGGDPLALLVAGFVLGWQARRGGNS